MKSISKKLLNTKAAFLLSIFFVNGALAPGCHAQDHPNHQRGFRADKVYQLGNVDSINVFNGNLVLTLPIGGSYPVGGGLAFSLALTYNTQLWDFDYRCDQGDPGSRCYSSSEPHPGFNAGAGWTLSPGRLLPPSTQTNPGASWLYITGDGASHGFFATLHADDPEDPGDSGSNQSVLYTRDGSYLRLRVNGGGRVVEFGNGLRQHFVPGPADEWLIIRTDDPFGNFIDVSYHPNAAAYTEQRFTDSHGRQQKIIFQQTGDPLFPRLLQRVELLSVGGNLAIWSFQTQWETVPRGCPHNDPMFPDTGVQIPLLTRILLPDGSTYRIPVSDYHVPSNPASCTATSGRIKGLGLPTGGKIEWTYTSYSFPAGDPHPDPTSPPPWEGATGVGTRTVKRANDSVVGVWTYTPRLQNWPGTPQDPFPNELQVTLRDPLGHETVHYFSVDRDGIAWEGEYTARDYGLPFTREETPIVITDPFDGSQTIELFLSKRSYSSGGTLRRTHYVAYERDPASVGIEDAQNSNRRPRAERTVYHNDGGTYVETIRGEFDGIGQFRREVRRGNFQADQGRTSITNFNPARGTYAVDSSGNTLPGYAPLPASEPWILGTYTYQDRKEDLQQNREPEEDGPDHPGFVDPEELEAIVAGRVETTFDLQTGFLQCRRVLEVGTSRGTSDVLEVFEPDGDGNVHVQKTYGGDLQTLPTTVGCSPAGLPAQPEIVKRHDYQHGVIARSVYLQGCDGNSEFLEITDFTIDPSTGLVTRSLDPSGLETLFHYDGQGRILSEEPAEEAGTYYNYIIANPTTGTAARVEVSRRVTPGSSKLTEQRYLYDGLGRVCREEIRRPDGGWAGRDHLYWATNWKKESTEQLAANGPLTSCRTSLTGLARQTFAYDPFGRMTRLVPADGGAHDIEIDYLGVRQIKRRVHIATGSNGAESEIHTVERYNPHGQLRRVVEQFNTANPLVTEYAYDVEGNLRAVAQGAQTRIFSRDRRGFLQWEQQPELGSGGQGTRSYDVMDSTGKVRRMSEGNHRLLYTYDAAERLTRIDEMVDTSGNGQPDTTRRLEERTYHRSNRPSEWSLGKLYQAKRHNYGSPVGPLFMAGADLIVTETYRYGGRSGRVSERQTRLSNRGDAVAFEQGFTYNDLGLLGNLTYPRCLQAPCAGNDPARSVTYQYSSGRLSGVPGWASQVKYHPNSLLSEVRHSNGVTDVQLSDPQSIARPRRIHFSGPAVNWTPANGDYQYDGAGNIKTIGVDRFQYDTLNRLIHANLASSGGQSQAMSYDRYGNVTQIVRNGVPSNVPIQASSNHLSGNAVYDASGNLTYQLAGGQAQQLAYDSQNRVQTLQTPDVAKGYVYTVDGERLLEIDFADPWTETWSMRDLSGKVLRQWKHVPSANGGLGDWTWQKDYIYRDGQLLASTSEGTGVRHYHLDHLGSPRLITDGNGIERARHTYFPFGEEATNPFQDLETMKFTGHERDRNGPGIADDLDYMHARYYSPGLCRFLSVDPANSAKPGIPQSWNAYTYASNDPMANIDPDGRESLGIMAFERDNQALLNGEITAEEFQARLNARGAPALAAAALISPIDEVSVGSLMFDAGVGLAGRLKVGARIGGFFRKLFQKSRTSVDDILKDSKRISPEKLRKNRAAQFERPGGSEQANADFDSLNLENVVDRGNGIRTGQLKDGRTVVVRDQSTTGSPTLEIQGKEHSIKIRFPEIRQ